MGGIKFSKLKGNSHHIESDEFYGTGDLAKLKWKAFYVLKPILSFNIDGIIIFNDEPGYEMFY